MKQAPPETTVDRYRENGIEVWVNDRYQCLVHNRRQGDGTMVKQLSIHLHDRSPARNWRHLQQIKNECCGELWTGVEIFPPEDQLTDTANEYHMFCFPPEIKIGLGLGEDAVVSDDEMATKYTDDPTHKGKQEPWEDGLTTGRTPASSASRERMREFANEQYGYGN